MSRMLDEQYLPDGLVQQSRIRRGVKYGSNSALKCRQRQLLGATYGALASGYHLNRKLLENATRGVCMARRRNR